MKKIAKLHYISQGDTFASQKQNIQEALDQGAEWVQLRWKHAVEKDLRDLAYEVKHMCSSYKATFIVNDHVELAKSLDADGVHLGLDDMSISYAKLILGEDKIYGGTANTFQNVIKRIHEGSDYIGLGPFRFTTTKQNLSPILGIEGYESVIDQLIQNQVSLPKIIAIGGITKEDLSQLKAIGIYGVALSSAITTQPTTISTITALL